jgi:hypothetical protein
VHRADYGFEAEVFKVAAMDDPGRPLAAKILPKAERDPSKVSLC